MSDWISTKDRLPDICEPCDWIFPSSFLKHERWMLCNECMATASVPGSATHWRIAQPLPEPDQRSST